VVKAEQKPAKFLVVGHRGKGMNSLASPDRRMKEIKENSILSFNAAGRFPIDLVEFDVQVQHYLAFFRFAPMKSLYSLWIILY
jgi:glycerophosphoryl diester phosphodiesterase